jgi:uncharacterized membrane protein YcaP (DUF421 family)
MSLLIVAGQTLAIYVFLVFTLSLLGRSLMAGLTPFQYLIVALLGSAVETGLYRGGDSLSAGLVSAAALVLADRATTSLVGRWPRLRRLLAGAPVVLVHDGQVIPSHLRQARLTEEDVRAAVRQRGYEDLGDVRLAVLEANGQVGVLPRSKPASPRQGPATPAP